MGHNIAEPFQEELQNDAQLEMIHDQMTAFDIGMTKNMIDRIQTENLAIRFGILVIFAVEVGLIGLFVLSVYGICCRTARQRFPLAKFVFNI